VQEQKLHDDEEQTSSSGQARAQEILSVLPQAHSAQGNALEPAFFKKTRQNPRFSRKRARTRVFQAVDIALRR
jgi:hypothetical protein